MKKITKERMMNRPSLLIVLLLGTALGTNGMRAMETPQKQTLLQQLIVQYQVNRNLIRLSQSRMQREMSDAARKELNQKIEQFKEKNRAIIKRAARAGLVVALVAALAATAAIAARKYGAKAGNGPQEKHWKKETEEVFDPLRQAVGEEPLVERLLKEKE